MLGCYSVFGWFSFYSSHGRLAPETLLYTVLIYRDPLALASSYALAKISWLLASDKQTLGDGDRLVELYIRFHRRVEGDRAKYSLEVDGGPLRDAGWRLIEKILSRALSKGWTPS